MSGIVDHVGKRVRFRPHFLTDDASGEGEFVGYVDMPQALILMDDGTQQMIDVRLLVEVEHSEWRPIHG